MTFLLYDLGKTKQNALLTLQICKNWHEGILKAFKVTSQ